MDQISWQYPVFIIGTPDGDVLSVPYQGMTCCLAFRQKELAELYIEENSRFDARSFVPMPVESPATFLDGLKNALSGGVTHIIWDTTFHPSVCKMMSVTDLIEDLGLEIAEGST